MDWILPAILDHIMDVSRVNTGQGLTKIGLKNIEYWIKMIYGPDYGLSITSTSGYGTQVTISLPVTASGGGNIV